MPLILKIVLFGAYIILGIAVIQVIYEVLREVRIEKYFTKLGYKRKEPGDNGEYTTYLYCWKKDGKPIIYDHELSRYSIKQIKEIYKE